MRKIGRGHICEHGLVERSEHTGRCLICRRVSSRRYATNNPDKIKASAYKYYHSEQGNKYKVENKERQDAYMSKYRKDNAEKLAIQSSIWLRKNKNHMKEVTKLWRDKNRDHYNFIHRKWRMLNKAKTRVWSANKKKAVKQRTPAWSCIDAIRFFYECCPDGCHVDHIIPLRGKNISGLHIETNLQWLTASQNSGKHNKWPYRLDDWAFT